MIGRILNRLATGALLAAAACTAQAADPTPEDLKVPDGVWAREGIEVSIALTGINKPRYMVIDPATDTLYLNSPNNRPGFIYACKDTNGDGYYETQNVFAEGTAGVVGMQFHDGWLWYAQTAKVTKARDTNGDGKADESQVIVDIPDLARGSHWYRPLLIHNNRLYTGLGDDGNINEPKPDRQELVSYALDGSDKKPFVTGVRNTEWLAVRPGTDEIWGVDNGSDWFGKGVEPADDPAITNLNPPEEVNHYVEGGFYGHPWITGNRMPRLEFLDKPDIGQLAAKTTPPAWCAPPHWAPLVIIFYHGDQFPMKGDAFITYHGSWNRQPPDGYCVTRLLFDDGKPYGELKILDFLPKGASKPLGRPVAIVEEKDGSLLVSEDLQNKVYRLKWKGAK